MRRVPFQVCLLVAITAIVMFTNLGSARLWDRDEPRNAGCAVEMMQRGDLIVPMFNDELRHQKPVLLYWLTISAYQVFGVNEFAARFWSAILAIGSVLATYAIGRRLFSSMAGLYGGITLATSMMFVVAGRAATPDSLLIFCSTMAMLFYVFGTFAPRIAEDTPPVLRKAGVWFPDGYRYVVGMYAMMGLAVLAKGPVGFVLPCAIIGMFLLLMRLPATDAETWNRQGWLTRWTIAIVRPFAPRHFLATLWTMRPLSLAAIVLLVAAPWYVAVGVQTNGDWPRIFFLNENLARATTSFESHSGGWWFYPLTIVVGCFPASIFLGPMILRIDRQITARHPWTPAYVLMLCWVAVQVGLFSLASTKLPSYITPCYPAIGLLIGAFLAQLSTQKVPLASLIDRWPAWGMLFSGVGTAVALAIVGIRYLEGSFQIGIAGFILIGGAAAMIWYSRRQQHHLQIQAFCLTAVIFATGIFSFGAPFVDSHREESRILARIAESPSPVCATFGCLESSWVFYVGKPIYELTPALQTSPWQESRKHDWLKKNWPSPEQFSAAYPDALIITTDVQLAELQSRLPDYEVVETARYFLKDHDLVLLGRSPDRDKIRSTQAPGGANFIK